MTGVQTCALPISATRFSARHAAAHPTNSSGEVAAKTCAKTRIGADLDPLLDEFHDRTLQGCWPPERAHVVDGYAQLLFPFERLPVPGLAIEREWGIGELLAYVHTWSGVTALVRAGRSAGLERFESALRAVWGERRRVRWPLTVLAARLS